MSLVKSMPFRGKLIPTNGIFDFYQFECLFDLDSGRRKNKATSCENYTQLIYIQPSILSISTRLMRCFLPSRWVGTIPSFIHLLKVTRVILSKALASFKV